ncbi:phosphoribosylformylglycinamidine synthase [Schaedlerella arabinosiphila]|uniref:Phosphoribosylformylglycinamidine synthase n=1 Tax=Schaedlerella arabinosiphila TaxID=2044587 RepID=A0A9X5C9Y7_9FIRM|nr:phosphoribosylformylglycinamidine synthase [Schaedlerella arabinosiphila]KAI4444127.1 Phosphoribosylformylglycinamidine synthase [Schaedlerella arabinosiphila]NDO70471.1 phosphoribosylformylglycinamidine synthase [Schaedlerella arabinosiphila]
MGNVKRVYVEKKADFAVQAKELKHEIRHYLGIRTVTGVRVLIRYDVENVSEESFERACRGVFAEPPVDLLYREEIPVEEEDRVFSVEYLPGQFDQRADSAEQCIQFIKEDEKPVIRTAVTYVIQGTVTDEEFAAIKNHCINPVDSRETGLEKPDTLVAVFEEPEDVKILSGFRDMQEEELRTLYDSLGLAMTFQDFLHIRTYFLGEERRDPSMTEIRVLDTYWSDHCRHTTFSTELKNVSFGEGDYREPIEDTYRQYVKDHSEIFAGREDKFHCLMDLALMAMRKLKKEGKLADQEESDEINACSIVVPIKVDGVEEEWLINFKNETHNHPTEIEPFGGAATCLGGAIRDPLSGRTYVYQAMRVTGAADPTVSAGDTLKGKLPQKKLVQGAARGYSSYGNQIGLATGTVKEIYHPDYVAKRMEIGAVMGAAPRRAVIRETSDPGDIIILLGGRTGRDGCGGATGSSKVHTEESIETCGAEVQKGNPPTERKIQRLFRREEVSRLIKKCNDFGAGGVSVAIGELAEGLRVDLDKVPKKYAGLDGTEIAISESQERMAVVVDPKDAEQFLAYAGEENLEATEVAVVTEAPRLVLVWRGTEIVNLSRAFLDTNGAHQETDVEVEIPGKEGSLFVREEVADVREKWLSMLADLNVCSQKGLVEMFDGSIGAASVFMPHGGKYQMTETQAMAAKVPVQNGTTDSVSMMSYGFDPYLSSWSPYHGAIYAVTESIAKIVASGGDYRKIRFTFQEYFRRMTEDPKRWSQPFAALLGAYRAQLGFGLPSIGGKDSMSGTFQDIDVPPTLVSFAVDMAVETDLITPELKTPGNKLVWLRLERDGYDLPVYEQVMEQYGKFTEDIRSGRIVSAYALDRHGVLAAVSKMAFGNKLGVKIEHNLDPRDAFAPAFGDLIAEVKDGQVGNLQITYTVIGEVTEGDGFSYGNTEISMEEAVRAWSGTLEPVFATKSAASEERVLEDRLYDGTGEVHICSHKIGQPTVFIPVFPGTNCEYDSGQAFQRAGAKVITSVFRNLDAQGIRESVEEFEKAIGQAQMIMFPGGFSAGDEPDGSAKFFATAFMNARIKEAVEKLLHERDGLALGICNGFQALIKLGLVPYGRIVGQTEDSPTLTYNTIGRHISKMVYTKVVSSKSPWLAQVKPGSVFTIPASHGEGRFVANDALLETLFENGQVATRYCDPQGVISMDEEWNVNGSYQAIEGITSPDGRVLGKMAHSERRGPSVAVNIYGEQDMKIFESGVAYFR